MEIDTTTAADLLTNLVAVADKQDLYHLFITLQKRSYFLNKKYRGHTG